MTYLDAGYNKLMYKTTATPVSGEMSEDKSTVYVSQLSGANITGGITQSTSGRVLIDWDMGKILVGDGANWRVLIGEDGL